MLKKFLFTIIILFAFVWISVQFMGGEAKIIGISEGKLQACPETPNCVCSQWSDPEHYISPFEFKGRPEEAMSKLKDVLKTEKRVQYVTEEEGYLHLVFKTGFFRFKDDVEFLIVPESKLIHVRSASRVGSYDFNLNRQRVEEIRTKFTAKN